MLNCAHTCVCGVEGSCQLKESTTNTLQDHPSRVLPFLRSVRDISIWLCCEFCVVTLFKISGDFLIACVFLRCHCTLLNTKHVSQRFCSPCPCLELSNRIYVQVWVWKCTVKTILYEQTTKVKPVLCSHVNPVTIIKDLRKISVKSTF